MIELLFAWTIIPDQSTLLGQCALELQTACDYLDHQRATQCEDPDECYRPNPPEESPYEGVPLCEELTGEERGTIDCWPDSYQGISPLADSWLIANDPYGRDQDGDQSGGSKTPGW